MLIMGTAAAEGWPAVWCRCDHCQEARRRGGKDIRTRAGAVVDGVLKIDFGPDTYMQALQQGVDLSRLEHLIVTHTHQDHFAPDDLALRGAVYAHGLAHDLTVWGGDRALAMARRVLAEGRTTGVNLRRVRPFEPFAAGEFRVTPLLADHNPLETCYIYLIEREGRRLLWGHDTDLFPEETWAYLGAQPPLHAVVLDATNGPLTFRGGHMGIGELVDVRRRMLAEGMATAETRFVATHFSHNGGLLHADLEARLGPEGFLVAYDGMRLCI
nr:MBL fold metallo-hydrolase [Symbiobacterium terraclitae]